MSYIENPKTKWSGILGCIPQMGICPNNCPDCFFQSGRSYLEPLSKNLPNLPSVEQARGRVVRMNDGNDSNVQRELVEGVAQRYNDYFFNTSLPIDLKEFSGPVVLTINPGKMTDDAFHSIIPSPNLMFIRVLVNAWNAGLVTAVVNRYAVNNTGLDELDGVIEVPVVLTFMAYHSLDSICHDYRKFYEYRKRTLNSYYCLTKASRETMERLYKGNPFVYSCSSHDCRFCGNCLREYYVAKERLCQLSGETG